MTIVFRCTSILSLTLLIGHIGAFTFSPRLSSSFDIIGSGNGISSGSGSRRESVVQKNFGTEHIKKNNRYDNIPFLSMQRNNNDDDDNNDDECFSTTTNNVSSRREWLMKLSSTSATASILTFRTQNAFAEEENTLTLATTTTTSSSITQQSTTTTTNILCDPSVSIFYNQDKKRTVYLLGTAHISSKSADAAAQLVRDMKPKAVFVELDAKRVGRAIPKPNPETWPMPPEKKTQSQDELALGSSSGSSNNDNNTENDGDGSKTSSTLTASAAVAASATTIPNVGQVIQEQPESQAVVKKQPKFFDFREMALRKGSEIVGNSIKGLYSKLEAEGFNAGEEFVVAVKEGLKINSKIILGDRDVEVTLRRLTEALARTDLKKLLAADSELEENMKQLLPQDVSPSDLQNGTGDMSTEQLKYFVETVKAKDNVRLLMSNLKAVAPEVYQAMVAERDEYMANGLDKLDQFESIVAVMGIAHVDGVENTLRNRGWVEMKPICDGQ